jgi:hypothetical protein
MRKVVHKFLSFIMVFLVLFSTLSFAVNMHYCGGALVETAVFQKAKGCGMDMDKLSSEGYSLVENTCCKNEIVVVEGQDELKISFDKIPIEQQVFAASRIYSYTNLFEGLDENISSYEYYKPPRVVQQLYKLDETYLI